MFDSSIEENDDTNTDKGNHKDTDPETSENGKRKGSPTPTQNGMFNPSICFQSCISLSWHLFFFFFSQVQILRNQKSSYDDTLIMTLVY